MGPSGTGRAAALDRPAIGKTGTSQDHRDAWFIGGTADYVAGVWLGNDEGQPMQQVTGGALPARLWKRFMVEAHRGIEAHPFPGASSGFDLDGFIDSLFRGGGAPSGAPALSEPRQRVNNSPSSTGTVNDPMNRPGAPQLN